MTAASSLQTQLARVRVRVAEAAGEDPGAKVPKRAGASPVDDLAARFGLSSFERDVLLLAALPELEPGAADLMARAQGDPRRQLPTVAFALSVLADGHWNAFSAEGPLREGRLIELGDEPASSARPIQLPERVLQHLVGVTSPDASVLQASRRLATGAPLAGAQRAAVAQLGERVAAAPATLAAPIVQVLHGDRALAAELAAVAAEAAGKTAYLMDAEALPAGPDRQRLAGTWSREARLGRALPVLDAHDAAGPAEMRAAARFAEAIAGPVLVLVPTPLLLVQRPDLRAEIPRPSIAEQTASWREALGPLAKRLEPAIAEVACTFSATSDIMTQAAAAVRALADPPGQPAKGVKTARPKAARPKAAGPKTEALAEALWTETRARTRPKLEQLAQRLDLTAGWGDIILPSRQLDTLKAIAAQVRRRAQVYEDWGFGGLGRRGLGISALFAGPSGTGKTLSAEVIGSALGLDVYRIDLSAVVSKWIGETEKNLRRVFDAAEETSAVLLFDEADALFGKRSEVKESHDRYANIEISYLLQRMETYRGLAILTTNLRSSMDTAFLRRLRFVVEFPFPAEPERREIWRLAFPEKAPRDGLDLGRLAQLNVPGGSIKNIALNAAFIAADAGQPIRMIHVRTAARAEYDKLGKPLTDGELRGWTLQAVHG
jgi:hypothetical protein